MTRKFIIELLLLLSVAIVAIGAVDTWAQFGQQEECCAKAGLRAYRAGTCAAVGNDTGLIARK